MKRSIWIGHDPREQDAFEVAVRSIAAHSKEPIPTFAVSLEVLQSRGLYTRPTEHRDGRLWDVTSDAPMSTEFAISRFFVPLLAGPEAEWAVFMDCDVLLRTDIAELFELADPAKAIQVVKHDQRPTERVKMDGQVQTAYPRKNWSSVMLWNLRHPAHQTLTAAKLNAWAGRALHGFQWLADEFIGDLPAEWNHLVGVEPPNPAAKLVHFTLGTPSMDGYADCEFASEWWENHGPRPEPLAQPQDVEIVACPTVH